jgi:hypothetical protein
MPKSQEAQPKSEGCPVEAVASVPAIQLPRPTVDQEEYLSRMQQVASKYDETAVIGGACRYNAADS